MDFQGCPWTSMNFHRVKVICWQAFAWKRRVNKTLTRVLRLRKGVKVIFWRVFCWKTRVNKNNDARFWTKKGSQTHILAGVCLKSARQQKCWRGFFDQERESKSYFGGRLLEKRASTNMLTRVFWPRKGVKVIFWRAIGWKTRINKIYVRYMFDICSIHGR